MVLDPFQELFNVIIGWRLQPSVLGVYVGPLNGGLPLALLVSFPLLCSSLRNRGASGFLDFFADGGSDPPSLVHSVLPDGLFGL